ncbi:hypothetical protein ACJX0J_035802, partial [Zea mays]
MNRQGIIISGGAKTSKKICDLMNFHKEMVTNIKDGINTHLTEITSFSLQISTRFMTQSFN